MTRRALRAEPLGYTFSYDPDRRRLHVFGSDFERDITEAGKLVREGLIGIPRAVVHSDATLSFIVRGRCLDTLLGIWGVASPGGRQ